MTSHLLEEDINNKDGFWYSFIHRSADEGKSWESTRIGPEGFPPKSGTVSDRKAVELLDGTVLLGVSSGRPDPRAYIWRSTDYGRTWDTSTGCDVMGWSDMDGYFSNSETFLLPSGKLLHINRVDGSNHPIEGRPFLGTKGDDNTDRSILWESTDNGVSRFRRLRRDVSSTSPSYGQPAALQLYRARHVLPPRHPGDCQLR